jgi:hypothetical protein
VADRGAGAGEDAAVPAPDQDAAVAATLARQLEAAQRAALEALPGAFEIKLQVRGGCCPSLRAPF